MDNAKFCAEQRRNLSVQRRTLTEQRLTLAEEYRNRIIWATSHPNWAISQPYGQRRTPTIIAASLFALAQIQILFQL
jgi:hypothetical protein